MRIIGGQAKGRRLFRPKGSSLRPTSDMIKEALFNLLPDMSGKKFLDLFAGIGSVGIEALSRGAEQVVFVEKNSLCIETIRRNIRHSGFEDRYECLGFPAEKALKLLGRRGDRFDAVFIDPPYEKGILKKALHEIAAAPILSPAAVVVVQRSVREGIEEETGCLIMAGERKYGDTVLSFLKMK